MFMKAPFSGMKKDVKEDNRARYVTNVAQYFPQIPLVFEDLDVIDNVLAPYRERDREKALRLAEAMGLGQVANSLASSLSSGERSACPSPEPFMAIIPSFSWMRSPPRSTRFPQAS